MLHDRNVTRQQRRVNWPLARVGAVDVQRVDADQNDARGDEPLRDIGNEVWMSLEVLIRSPVAVPSRVDEDRCSSNITLAQREVVDGSRSQVHSPRDNARKIGEGASGNAATPLPSG